MGCMMRPYTTRAVKENQQPKMAESGVKRRLATGPSSSPSSTGKVEVVVMRLARRNRFRMGYPCTPQSVSHHCYAGLTCLASLVKPVPYCNSPALPCTLPLTHGAEVSNGV